MKSAKHLAFLHNARLLQTELGITPLLYGSLGLECRAGIPFNADDVDMLIPECWLTDKWPMLKALLEQNGYVLTDEHEHDFLKDGIHYAYARLEELAPFAGILPEDIETIRHQDVSFLLLSLAQYRKVYTASAKDGYRIHTRGKKDNEKIALIDRLL